MDWTFRIESDGTITPRQDLTEPQLAILEAKLKVALARVHLMMLERRLRIGAQLAPTSGLPASPQAEEAPRQDKQLLTAHETAELLGIGRSTCYELLRTGQIPSIRLGRKHRVPLST